MRAAVKLGTPTASGILRYHKPVEPQGIAAQKGTFIFLRGRIVHFDVPATQKRVQTKRDNTQTGHVEIN
jgi:leucyl aminopeptidase (aminopeptidase T)